MLVIAIENGSAEGGGTCEDGGDEERLYVDELELERDMLSGDGGRDAEGEDKDVETRRYSRS